MSASYQIADWPQIDPGLLITPPPKWYAVQTRSRHEKLVAYQLQIRSIEHYLPVATQVHRWSDRRKRVEVPLFSGYVFVRVVPNNQERVRVLRINGAVRFIGNSAEGTPIPDQEIEGVRMLIEHNIPCATYPFLKVGQRIRIRGGALDGLEGIFQSRNGEETLVVSVDAIQRSLSVSMRGYHIEVV
ncbi:MAG: UpxY family transcription antiterminator [Acidobacteria bacterium]|nr:UpxY family transcription antiterminator [Acidobacteriota bacterium]